MADSAQKDTPEQAAFREECKAWMQDNRPGEPPVRLPLSPLEIMTEPQLEYLQAWQKSAYDAGLIGCDYPVAVGGGGRNDCQRVANEEMIRAKTPFLPNVIGLGMAAPTVFYHGQDALKERLLPRLARTVALHFALRDLGARYVQFAQGPEENDAASV